MHFSGKEKPIREIGDNVRDVGIAREKGRKAGSGPPPPFQTLFNDICRSLQQYATFQALLIAHVNGW